MPKRSKLPKSAFFSLATIILLLFIPLYPKFPLFNISGTYVAIRSEDLLVAGIVLTWLVFQVRHRWPIFREKITWLILLYWGIGALSLLSALLITKTVKPYIGFLHFIRRVEYMSLFFIALSAGLSRSRIKAYLSALFLATLIVFIYGIGQKYLGWPVISTMNEEFSKGLLLQLTEWTRVNATFAGHYDLATYLVIILPLIIASVIAIKKKGHKVFISLLGILALYLLTLTASRISFVAYLIAAFFVLILMKKKFWIVPVFALSFVLMFFSDDLNQRFKATFSDLEKLDIPQIEIAQRVVERELEPTETPTPVIEEVEVPFAPVAKKRILPTATPTPEEEFVATTAAWPVEPVSLATQRSTNIRFKVEWPRAIRAFLKNPFFGTGFSSVTLATDNDYLRLLAETGLLGFASFFLIFLEIARRTIGFFQKRKDTYEKIILIGIIAAAIGVFANAIFIDVFEASKIAFIFWILMGVSVGVMRGEYGETA